MFNSITNSGCVVKTITITESISIRVNKGATAGAEWVQSGCIKFLTGIANRGCPSSNGTRNNFGCFVFNGMKMRRSRGQKVLTKTIRNRGWDNCGGCRVFDSKDSWVSLTLLTAVVAISVSVGCFENIQDI